MQDEGCHASLRCIMVTLPGSAATDTLQSSMRYCCGNSWRIVQHSQDMIQCKCTRDSQVQCLVLQWHPPHAAQTARPCARLTFLLGFTGLREAGAQQTGLNAVHRYPVLTRRPKEVLLKYHGSRQPVQRPGRVSMKARGVVRMTCAGYICSSRML